MERTYRISDVVRNNFLRLPLSLFANPGYRVLSPESKLTYSLLLDRMSLSQKNGWLNEEGEVYLIYTREEVAETLNISYKKSIAAFKELIEAGLLIEERQGRGFPNLLYVLKDELSDDSASEFNDSFDKCEPTVRDETEPANPQNQQTCQNGISRTAETEYQDMPKSHIKICRNSTSRTAESAHQDMPESHPIQTYSNYINNNHTECNQSVNQPESEGLTEILRKCELDIFTNEIRQMFTDAITRLYYSSEFKIGRAVLPQTQIRAVLSRIQADYLLCVLDTMRRNAANIKNPIGYLMALIINAVCEEKTDLILSLPPDYQGNDFYASD